MEANGKKLVIGFITYGKATAKYLPYFLPSLTGQTYNNFKIVAVDNTEEEINENSKFINSHYPEIAFEWAGANIGFARAYNRMIEKAASAGAEYFLMLNPDMLLDADAVEKLVEAIGHNQELGSASPKILKWDFANEKKTVIIDTCGIILKPGLRFIDLGQGQVDNGSFNDFGILGPSGAAAMFRVSALEKVKQNNGYFDELMFMYKEDCDLDYRLKLAGYGSKLISGAIIYHDRTASGKGEGNIEIAVNRKRKNRQVKIWSFLNQHIILLKYWKTLKISEKIALLWFALRMLVFALLFEQYLLKQYAVLWKLKKKKSYILYGPLPNKSKGS